MNTLPTTLGQCYITPTHVALIEHRPYDDDYLTIHAWLKPAMAEFILQNPPSLMSYTPMTNLRVTELGPDTASPTITAE